MITADLEEEFDELSADGFRVLAIAYRDVEPKAAYSKEDERDMILRGYVAFLGPPKDTARSAIAALQADGISVKVLTGDNELVSRKICREVGIATDQVLLGSQVEGMSGWFVESLLSRLRRCDWAGCPAAWRCLAGCSTYDVPVTSIDGK